MRRLPLWCCCFVTAALTLGACGGGEERDDGGTGAGSGDAAGASTSTTAPPKVDTYTVESTGAVAFKGSGSVQCVIQGFRNRKEWRFDNTADGYGLQLDFNDFTRQPNSAELTVYDKAQAIVGDGKVTVQQSTAGGTKSFSFDGSYSGKAGPSQLKVQGSCVERDER
ncbi:MAG: hypothetical protein M3N28_08225 [Actinomycetota bacterium]|nr:hypothetical protein [Actinomycetota bacterium]